MAVYFQSAPPALPNAGDQWIDSRAATFGVISVFDGAIWKESTAIAAAGTLTGTTLAANVVSSSLTSFGTLTSLTGTGGTLTLPAGADTLVGRATTDTLTNKTLTSPTLTSPTMTSAVVTAGGLQVTAGNVGIGAAPISNSGLTVVGNVQSSSGFASGVSVAANSLVATANSDFLVGYLSNPTWNANSHTSVKTAAFYAANGTVANQAATAYGMYVEAMTTGGTNNYGIYVNTPSGGGGANESIHVTGGTFNMAAGGIVAGGATGGDKGNGTVNVATNVFLNGTAYTNPHGGFEAAYTGQIVKYADRMKAMGMPDWQHMSMDAMEAYTREHMHFPGFADEDERGLFDGGERVLLMLEWLTVHAFDMNKRMMRLEGVA